MSTSPADLDGTPLYRRRACDTFSYALSPGPDGEQALYDATTAYLRHTYDRALDNRPAIRLAMGVFQRRLASSTPAVLRSFERRITKIEQTIDDLRLGRITASELRSRQRRLDREHREDFFDTHGADDDARDAGDGERHEDYEEALLGAVAAVTIEELQHEIEALTDDGERRVVDHVTSTLTASRVDAVAETEARVYGPLGEVADRLGGLRADVERERYLQLLPGYVRRFVQKSASLLGLRIRGDLDGRFSLAPGRSGALDALLPALESYPPPARERLCVRRPTTDEPCVWLHPGEPVFDALLEQVVRTYGSDAVRGGIFTDPKADAPYLFHLGLASVEQEPDDGGRADTDPTAGETASAEPRILERRLFALRHETDGVPSESPVEHLLLLHGAPGVAPGAVPLATRGIGMRAAAAAYAEHDVSARMVDDCRARLRTELPERRRRIGTGFDLRAAELAGRRAKLAAGAAGGTADAELDAIKQEQRALSAERRDVLARTDAAPERIVPGGVRFLAHALVVPARAADERERYDARVEEIAVRIATAWEQERGGAVRDVSRPDAARLAGLPDWPGFDLLATRPNGDVRSIEVKGRAGESAVQLELNEWKPLLSHRTSK